MFLLAFAGLACVDRAVVSDDEAGETSSPFEPGEPFASCIDADDCDGEWCVSPQDEPGFCTQPCVGGEFSCMLAPGGTATEVCLPVSGEEVCALDCGGGRSCPAGMRCETISAGGQARSICF